MTDRFFHLLTKNINILPDPVSRYNDWLRSGGSGDRIPVGARLSAHIQTGPGAHPSSCTMGTGSFPGVKSGQGLTLTPHPNLAPWSRKGRTIPLLPLWAVGPVQSLSACTRAHFTFYFTRSCGTSIRSDF
jgi:DNA-binding transcriptional LysR family regulator